MLSDDGVSFMQYAAYYKQSTVIRQHKDNGPTDPQKINSISCDLSSKSNVSSDNAYHNILFYAFSLLSVNVYIRLV